jgi:hypothetical protein
MADDLLTQMLGDVGRAQCARQAFAGEPDFFRGVAYPLAIAAHHGIDRGANLFRDAPGRKGFGRRRFVEHGECALGRHAWGRDIFHARHRLRLAAVRNALA